MGCGLVGRRREAEKLEKILKSALPPDVFARIALPAHSDWSSKVFPFEYVGMREVFENVCLTHMCCMDVRYLFSGEETIIGIPADDVAGEDLRVKRKYLLSASSHEMLALVRKSGWCVTHTAARPVVVPSGFFTIIFTEAGAHGLRWSLSGDSADIGRVSRMLTLQIQAHKELANPSLGYNGFLQFLTTD